MLEDYNISQQNYDAKISMNSEVNILHYALMNGIYIYIYYNYTSLFLCMFKLSYIESMQYRHIYSNIY